MKKSIYLAAIASFFVFGCSKENSFRQADDVRNGNLKSITINDENSFSVKLITLSDTKDNSITMLEFSNVNTYEKTLADLEAKLDLHEDDFLKQYENLDEKALNQKEEEIGFNEQLPLIVFENHLKFHNSMRQAFIIAEKEWLNNEYLDPKTDPSNIYPFSIVEMTLLNKDGEVKIGKSLFKFTKAGFVEFSDGDINKLISFDNGNMKVLDKPNVFANIQTSSSRSSDCTSWKGEDNWINYSSNKKVKIHEHFHSYPWKGTSETQITSYKKRGSHWRKYRISLGVNNQSIFYKKDDCSTVNGGGVSGWKRKKRKSISRHIANWDDFPTYRAKNNISVIGYFEYAGNSSYDLLSW